MKKITVGAGERFNKLTVIEMIATTENGFSVARCRCDCGRELTVKVAELRSGHKRSCGCLTWKERSAKSSSGIIGKRYGRLTVESMAGSDNRKYRLCWCRCDCGIRTKIRIARMLSGEMQSCGCLQREKAFENLAKAHSQQIKHGMSYTLTGKSWNSMMQRCFNQRSEGFHDYGYQGIVPCEFIAASPLNLLVLIGERPNAGMSLDRIDNSKGYYCGSCKECLKNGWPMNVRWSTPKEQALNRSSNRMIEIDGVLKTASQWCELLGLPKTSKKFYSYPKPK